MNDSFAYSGIVIWLVEKQNKLMGIAVSHSMVESFHFSVISDD